MKLNEVEKFLLVLVAIMTIVGVALTIYMLTPAQAEGCRMGFVLCDPDSSVNIREKPRKTGIVLGQMLCGDELTLDGKTQGEWLHVTGLSMEMDGGWINRKYVADARVTVEEFDAVTTAAKVRVREGVNGKITRRMKKGAKVRVLASSAGWCVTTVGFIRTEYLEKAE